MAPQPTKRVQGGAASVDVRARLAHETLAALRAGEPAVVEAALRALYPLVRARVFRLLGPRDDLEDAVQEALIGLARALPAFEGRSSLATLASTIVVRTATGFFGRQRPVALHLVREVPDVGDPEDRVASRQSLERLFRCLERMSPTLRVAFVLACVEGMTPSEVGEVLGVPSLVVRARVMRARREVFRLMKGDPFVDAIVAREPEERDDA